MTHSPTSPTPSAPPLGERPRLGRNVIALGLVSFLTDTSSEMIYPLLPAFLTTVLGASPAFLGVIEGAAESTAALLKLASGWWSDRVRRRKPLVVVGYTIASVARPLVAIAQTAGQVLAIRVSDRVGKGLRNAPRDALIADSVDPSIRGRAFGFHRAADNAGAVVGPLIAFALLRWEGLTLRHVFWFALVPGALAVAAVIFGVRDVRAGGGKGKVAAARERSGARGAPPNNNDRPAPPESHHRNAASPTDLTQPLGPYFWRVLAVLFLFTLGNSTDAFLLLRAQQFGIGAAWAPILWVVLHIVKTASNTPGGSISDRIGRVPTLVAGWAWYALIYAGFALATAAWQIWALFALYGLYFGLAEGAERALVADLVPVQRRGAAFGWYNLAIGIGALPASVIFGVIWDRAGASAAFFFGAALSIAAAVGLLAVWRRR